MHFSGQLAQLMFIIVVAHYFASQQQLIVQVQTVPEFDIFGIVQILIESAQLIKDRFLHGSQREKTSGHITF